MKIIEKKNKSSENLENKTLKEILASDDKNAIISALEDYIIIPTERHYEKNVLPEWLLLLELYNQSLPLRTSQVNRYSFQNNVNNRINNINTQRKSVLKFTIPKFAEQIDEIVNLIINSLLGKTGQYWDNHKLTSDPKNKILVEIFNSLLKTQLFNFNNIRLVEIRRIFDAVLLGCGWKKEYWKKKTEKVRKVKYYNANQKLDESGNIVVDEATGKPIIEYDENIEITEEITENNLAVDYVPAENMRIYYADTDPQNIFSQYEHIYRSLDECIELYSNFDGHLKNYTKYVDAAGAEISQTDYEERKRKNTTSSRAYKQFINPHIIELYVYNYCFHLLVEGNLSALKVTDILIPRQLEDRKDKYFIQENHCKFPYTPFYFLPRRDSVQGDGKGMRLYSQQVIADFFLNITQQGILKKVQPPVIFNPNFVNDNDINNAISGITQLIRTNQNAEYQQIDKIFQVLKFDYNTNDTFQFANYFYAKNEELSRISNAQTAPADNAFVKTLGGLQMQQQQLLTQINSAVALNSYFEQQFLFRCFLNIIQYLPEQFALNITGKNGIEYIILQKTYNNQIRSINDIIMLENRKIEYSENNRPAKNGKKIYFIDELYKLNLDLLTINFGSVSDQIRLNELTSLLAIYNPLFQIGLISKDDIAMIVNEISQLLNSNTRVQSDISDMEKINQENALWNNAWKRYYPMYQAGTITPEVFAIVMENSVPAPAKTDIDGQHIANHLPAMESHIAIHQAQIEQKAAAQQQLNQMAQINAQNLPNNMQNFTKQNLPVVNQNQNNLQAMA